MLRRLVRKATRIAMHGGFVRLSTCRPVPATRHAVSTMYACRLHARCTSASLLPLDIFGQTDNTRQSGPRIDCPLAYPGLVKRQAWLLDGHGSALSPRMFHYLGRGKLEVPLPQDSFACSPIPRSASDPLWSASRYFRTEGKSAALCAASFPNPRTVNRETETA